MSTLGRRNGTPFLLTPFAVHRVFLRQNLLPHQVKTCARWWNLFSFYSLLSFHLDESPSPSPPSSTSSSSSVQQQLEETKNEQGTHFNPGISIGLALVECLCKLTKASGIISWFFPSMSTSCGHFSASLLWSQFRRCIISECQANSFSRLGAMAARCAYECVRQEIKARHVQRQNGARLFTATPPFSTHPQHLFVYNFNLAENIESQLIQL